MLRFRSVGCLLACLLGWLVGGWLVGWLVGWLIDWLVDDGDDEDDDGDDDDGDDDDVWRGEVEEVGLVTLKQEPTTERWWEEESLLKASELLLLQTDLRCDSQVAVCTVFNLLQHARNCCPPFIRSLVFKHC